VLAIGKMMPWEKLMAPPHTNKPTTIIITAAAAALEVAL
jgi:hypothetical protein